MPLTVPLGKSKVELELVEDQQASLRNLAEKFKVTQSEVAGVAIRVFSEVISQAEFLPNHETKVSVLHLPKSGPITIFSDGTIIEVQIPDLKNVKRTK